MAVLFGKATSTINEHIKNIYEEGELREEATTHKFGISEFMRKAPIYYNLDVIISVGYRVKSHQGTQAKQKANEEYQKYQHQLKEEEHLQSLKELESDLKMLDGK